MRDACTTGHPNPLRELIDNEKDLVSGGHTILDHVAAIALGALLAIPVQASKAAEICAEISVTNMTGGAINISSSVSGAWTPDPRGWPVAGYVSNNDASPPSALPPGIATILFRSCSNGGALPTGTGGSLTLTGVGTLTWSAPWSLANGLGGTCDSGIQKGGGYPSFKISGASTSMGGNPDTCLYSFGVVPNVTTQSVQVPASQNSPQAIYVLGNNLTLWLERAPFGTVPPARQRVDETVANFQSLDIQNALVLGADGNLWREHAPFGNVPPARQQVDGSVRAFQSLDDQTILVLGGNGALWLEHAPFGNVPPARQQVDGSVKAFQGIDSQTVYVLGNDGRLWLEKGPFGTIPPARTQVEGDVQAFQSLIEGVTVMVLGTDGNLWLEFAPFGQVPPARTLISSAVRSFQGFQSLLTGVSALALGDDGKLWLLSYPPSNPNQGTRQQVDGNVRSFFGLGDGTQSILVVGSDGKLWLESAPFGKVPPARTIVDGSVF